MPDTTTPRRYRRSNLLLVLAAVSVTFMLFYPHIVSAQEDFGGDGGADDSSCPGASVVETFSGDTSEDTAPFTIDSESWQVVVETEENEDAEIPPITTVDVLEEESFSTIATQDFEGGEDGVIDVEGSGTYILGVFTDLQSYELTVQECGDSGSAGEAPDQGFVEDVQYEEPEAEVEPVETPGTGGPPLSVLAAVVVWLGVGGVLVARRFA